MRRQTAFLCLLSTLGLLGSACSMDVVPVHYSRVNSVKEAQKPLQRGPEAPGAFSTQWNFQASQGFTYDPKKIVIEGGVARLIDLKADRAILETTSGVPFAALDGFKEVPAPGHQGIFKYQLSPDAASWYYFDSAKGKWAIAGPSADQANTADEVSKAISVFHEHAAPGDLYLKIHFLSPSQKETVTLKAVHLDGIAPRHDSWK